MISQDTDKLNEVICEDATVKEAERMMVEHDVGSLAITSKNDDSNIVGTLTESDINDKVIAKGKDSSSVKAAEIMNKTLDKQIRASDEIIESMANKGSIDL